MKTPEVDKKPVRVTTQYADLSERGKTCVDRAREASYYTKIYPRCDNEHALAYVVSRCPDEKQQTSEDVTSR